MRLTGFETKGRHSYVRALSRVRPLHFKNWRVFKVFRKFLPWNRIGHGLIKLIILYFCVKIDNIILEIRLITLINILLIIQFKLIQKIIIKIHGSIIGFKL